MKDIMGLGGIRHKCKHCKAIGYVDKVTEDDVDKMLADSHDSLGVSPETIYKSKKKSGKIILKDGA